MINSQKYSNVYRNSYKKGENIRVNNNLKFSNKTLKKYKKIGIYNKTGEIIKVFFWW